MPLRRPQTPDDPDGAKRLKTDDTSGGYLFLPALVLNLPLPLLKDSDNISEGLTYLWKSAWGKNSEATLFETRQVDRDGTLPGVRTPKTCTEFNVPGNILKLFFISTILIRQEYLHCTWWSTEHIQASSQEQERYSGSRGTPYQKMNQLCS